MGDGPKRLVVAVVVGSVRQKRGKRGKGKDNYGSRYSYSTAEANQAYSIGTFNLRRCFTDPYSYTVVLLCVE